MQNPSDSSNLSIPPTVVMPAPEQPAPVETGPTETRRYLLPGFGVLVLCLEGGEWLKVTCKLVLPGNILGLFILLGLLGTGLIPLRWVAPAARLLLWLLPFLFLPIFILAMRDKTFWMVQGRALVGAVVIGTVLLWAVVGHFSQWMLKKRMKDEG